jgi:flagellar L-ring protein precursor FlgH
MNRIWIGSKAVVGAAGAAISLLAAATGCVTTQQAKVPVAAPAVATQMAVAPAPAAPIRHEPSLWSDNAPLGDLYADPKARRVGDVVTIKIVESSSATNNADTNTGRNTSLQASIDSFLGLEKKYTDPSSPNYKAYPRINPFGKVDANFDSTFKGSGSTSRSGDLTAYVTARVSGVMPNGDLHVQGFREIRVNHENQIISVEGFVRSRDISAENVVLSTYLADARITYSGTGIVNDKQRPGWLTRVLDAAWPF